jgi:hypothetical protein
VTAPHSIGKDYTMAKHIRFLPCAALALLAIARTPAAIAQGIEDPRPPTHAELLAMLDETLPALIGDDNKGLVDKLLHVQLGDPPSKTFDRAVALRAIFGRLTPSFASDCKKTMTPAGVPDPGECLASRGSQVGGGAFLALEFSKSPGFGNFHFYKRPADADVTPTSLVPVKLPEAEAYDRARRFLTMTFGLSELEIPMPPAGAKLPVKTLVQGFAGQGATGGLLPPAAIPIQQHVFLQRGGMVGISDQLTFVPLPGRAIVMLDDQGVQGALVNGWGDLMPHPGADPSRAKSRRQLLDEMADRLVEDIHAPVASLKMRLHLAGMPESTHQLLVPAIDLSVSPVPDDLDEAGQAAQWTTAGIFEQFLLVDPTEPVGDDD